MQIYTLFQIIVVQMANAHEFHAHRDKKATINQTVSSFQNAHLSILALGLIATYTLQLPALK